MKDDVKLTVDISEQDRRTANVPRTSEAVQIVKLYLEKLTNVLGALERARKQIRLLDEILDGKNTTIEGLKVVNNKQTQLIETYEIGMAMSEEYVADLERVNTSLRKKRKAELSDFTHKQIREYMRKENIREILTFLKERFPLLFIKK